LTEGAIDPTEVEAKELVLLTAMLAMMLAGLSASAVCDTGGNVFDLQYLLGHSELEMVRRYIAALGMEDALRAHEKASPVDMTGLRYAIIW
jgi:hypothetical protein